MKLLEKLKQVKDSIFWRSRLCEGCQAHPSSSNLSPCAYCHKGDLAYQNFESDDEWFNAYGDRINNHIAFDKYVIGYNNDDE